MAEATADTPAITSPAQGAVRALLRTHWPELMQRLGDRQAAFFVRVQASVQQRGLAADAASAHRYLNLCCALGPAFEDRPENEWALALLSDERLSPAVKLHQLLRRAATELLRRGADAGTLARSDAALLDLLDHQQRHADAEAAPLPRVACDIEAVELRLQDIGFRHEYRPLDGQWQRVPLPSLDEQLPPVRIGAQRAAPALISVISQASADGPAARLQLRQAIHGGCGGERHPAVRFLDGHGLSQHLGPAARQLSWPLPAPPPVPPSTGLGLALADETAPQISLLQLPSCGLRDEGVPLGAQALQVWTYPASQWLFGMQREPSPTLHWPPIGTEAPPAPATRCRIERNGAPVNPKGWVYGFDEELPAALRAGMAKLFEAWQASVQRPALQLTPGLFVGRQVLSWGWREGAGGLAGEAVMRAVADLDLGLSLDLRLDGELSLGGARTAVHLVAAGQARLQHSIRREQALPPLGQAVAGAVLRFAFPFVVHTDPVAQDDGIVCSEAGPCLGTLGGELGLRPRLSGGSGWQWYLRLASDPVLLPFTVHDPVLGHTRRSLALLPALSLVDWSLG